MEHAADGPAFILALEKSGWGDYVRQSTLLYPLANTAHVLAVLVFFASVAGMDMRLAGWFRSVPAAEVMGRLRPIAIGALLVVIATGFTLFTPEATAILQNPAFRLKLLAIVLALANVALLEWRFGARIRAGAAAAGEPEVPPAARTAALVSLALWLFVAACGRFIAYV